MISTRTALRESVHVVEMPLPLPARISLNGLARNIAWPAISRDLVEVAAAILLTDRSILRPRATLGPRRIHLRLPVRQPHVWKRAADNLADILGILGDDNFSFEFYRGRFENERLWNSQGPSSTQISNVERVALFSGGLDSATAAAIFAEQKQRVAYVTHYVRGIHQIEHLLSRIDQAYGRGAQTLHAQFYIRPEGSLVHRLRENSRRTRPFLFVSLAFAIAAAINAEGVYVCENGVLAVNLPLTPAMIPTRHAHSQFLCAMERFSKELFGQRLRVENPFELQTKGQMTRVFAPHPELALSTTSCWYQQWAGHGKNYGKGHCGTCLPCLVRFASLKAAGISIPKRHFDVDVNRLSAASRLSSEDARRLIPFKALCSFGKRIEGCRSWKQLLKEFPAIIESEPTFYTMTPNKWYGSLFQMMKRFAREIEQAFPERQKTR